MGRIFNPIDIKDFDSKGLPPVNVHTPIPTKNARYLQRRRLAGL
jgi:hypothetical protein